MSKDDKSFLSTIKILDSLEPNLNILVWGPGETSNPAWLSKRTEVIKALRDASGGKDTVVTSEELFKANPPPIEPGFAELTHAHQADIIIALVLATPRRQGGVYRELQLIAPYRALREKVWIFIPDVKTYVGSFHTGMLAAYREDHKVPLSWSLIKTCLRLREICINRVNEERKQRTYDRLEAFMHSKGKRFK